MNYWSITGIAVVVIILGAIAYFLFGGGLSGANSSSSASGNDQLTAEEVVDLEVQAQQEYEANGGTY